MRYEYRTGLLFVWDKEILVAVFAGETEEKAMENLRKVVNGSI